MLQNATFQYRDERVALSSPRPVVYNKHMNIPNIPHGKKEEYSDEQALRLATDIAQKVNGGGLDADERTLAIRSLKSALALASHPDTKRAIEQLLKDIAERERDPDPDDD